MQRSENSEIINYKLIFRKLKINVYLMIYLRYKYPLQLLGQLLY